MQKPAIDKIADYLARRDHSELELRQKLRRRYDEVDIVSALIEAHQRGWMVPAPELAEKVARELSRKNRGIIYINRYLQQKGLPPVAADREFELEKARCFLQQRFANWRELPYNKQLKVRRALAGRGFDFDTIRTVMAQSAEGPTANA